MDAATPSAAHGTTALSEKRAWSAPCLAVMGPGARTTPVLVEYQAPVLGQYQARAGGMFGAYRVNQMDAFRGSALTAARRLRVCTENPKDLLHPYGAMAAPPGARPRSGARGGARGA